MALELSLDNNQFYLAHRDDDIRSLALTLSDFSPEDRSYILQQVEGYQLARTKLPSLSQISTSDGCWQWPVRLSMEQCSSEATAQYKAKVMHEALACGSHSNDTDASTLQLVDLTGGLGIDAYYMHATDYVERDEQLCHIAQHNFALTGHATRVHHMAAEDFLNSLTHAAVIYIDPARRDSHGGKVFRLQDCTPDITTLYQSLVSKCDILMLKLSPMLDITEALRVLPDATHVYVVALRGEVKEVLVLVQPHLSHESVNYTCVNLETNDPDFRFTQQTSSVSLADDLMPYLYEPNAAIMKAGAYREVAAQYGLLKLSDNSHLYTSDRLIPDFPGRVWTAHEATKQELKDLQQANIICRNYPLRPEEVKKKYKLKDGGMHYLIGTRTKRPLLLLCERVR